MSFTHTHTRTQLGNSSYFLSGQEAAAPFELCLLDVSGAARSGTLAGTKRRTAPVSCSLSADGRPWGEGGRSRAAN